MYQLRKGPKLCGQRSLLTLYRPTHIHLLRSSVVVSLGSRYKLSKGRTSRDICETTLGLY